MKEHSAGMVDDTSLQAMKRGSQDPQKLDFSDCLEVMLSGRHISAE